MTNREFFKAIANNNITAEVIAKANEELTKLDARNEKRRNTETENDKANAEIAKDIIKFLSENGATLSADIAKALNLSTPKVNGVATNLINEGKLIATKVKVKGKGERTQYSLPTPTEETNEGEEVEGE
jgi:predicted transcriptional regulator